MYKIGSSAIANRIKKYLDKLVSKSQTGFLTGRYIGDSTRLIYDLMQHTESENIPGLLMLVDFQKAFDSVSWKFLYSVMEFLGFGPSIIRWIKTFNTKIKASVMQCGFLSDFFNIEKGCRQGDPMASYLFLMCAQILSLMVTFNTSIHGIFIKNKEFKLSQYADDTTIILDGTKGSLLAALNTIEIYGSMSGLRINTDKTKLVWIGKKRHSKDKIEVATDMDWGTTEFNLLGIEFSVDLEKMVDLNYNLAYLKIERNLTHWKQRYLTPLGKITVVKSLIIPKLNHLFISIPNPSDVFLKKISGILFKFIWDNKPDKISRVQITKEYLDGGLKMLNIDSFIKALKLTWLRRLLKQHRACWIPLIPFDKNTYHRIVFFGSTWALNVASKIENRFWQDVLNAWGELIDIHSNIDGFYERVCGTLWYNKTISEIPLFIPQLYNKGVLSPADILHENGEIFSLEHVNESFGVCINFLDYHRLYVSLKKYLSICNFKDNYLKKPFYHSHISLLGRSNKGCQDFYKILNRNKHNTSTHKSGPRSTSRSKSLEFNIYNML